MTVPRAARWTAVVIDRYDGTEHPMLAVRLRSQRSIDSWIAIMRAEYVTRGMSVDVAARRIVREEAA